MSSSHAPDVVELLNRPPFDKHLSLVDFHGLNAKALLQLVNDVLAAIDERQAADVRDEAEDATAVRMIDFLTTLNYKHGMDLVQFRHALLSGEADVVHPLLHWLLVRLEDLRKRAYVARFLRNLEIPEQYFADESILSLYQRHKELQQEFKEVHKELDKLAATRTDPDGLQRECQKLEQERSQLGSKMEDRLRRLTEDARYKNVDFDELLQHTRALRREQEEESKLFESFEKQRHELRVAEQRRREVARRLDDMRSVDVDADPVAVLERLRVEVEYNERLLFEELPKERADKLETLEDLERVLTAEPISRDDVEALEGEVDALHRQVEDLTAERDEMHQSVMGKLGFYSDQASAMEKKRDRLREVCRGLEDDVQDAQAEVTKLKADFQALASNGHRPKTDREMKEYMRNLSQTTATYKANKAELQALRAELEVLAKTRDILTDREERVQDEISQLEQRKGISGFQRTQQHLERVSAAKSELDHGKGSALDEISAIVDEINVTIRTKKAQLAPKIKELHEIRAAYEQLEREYTAKKKQVSVTSAGLDSERIKLEQELGAQRGALLRAERSYHFANALGGLGAARVAMLEQEDGFQRGQGRLNQVSATYEEAMEKRISQLKAEASRMRSSQKKIKDAHPGNVRQRGLFKQLRSLMKAKLDVQRVEHERAAQEEAAIADQGMGMGAQTLTFD